MRFRLQTGVVLCGMIIMFTGSVFADDTHFLPDGTSFWFCEAGGHYPFSLDSVNNRTNDKWHEYLLYSVELARMYALSRRFALGGTLFLDYDDYVNSSQMGLRIRTRFWLSPVVGIDLAPGIILSGSNSTGMRFSGAATINVTDVLAFVCRVDDLEPGHRSASDTVVFAGVLLRACL